MSDGNYSTLIVNRRKGLTEVTLNRPEVRNAFDENLISELTDVVSRMAREGSRALVLRGAGTNFCAGADLNWMRRASEYTREENVEDAGRLQQMFAAIAHFPGVTIAVVHGAAIGGGAGLAAVCDVTVSHESCQFALSEVRLGLVPAVIAPYVIEKIGIGAARSLFVTGERFDGVKALRIGLVQHLATAEEECETVVSTIVGRVMAASPAAIAAGKQLIRHIAGKSPDEAAAQTAACIADLRDSPEGREGIRAFLEKTRPSFAVDV